MTRFNTTNWSVVLKAASVDENVRRQALEALITEYWYPVYAFIRRSGESTEHAKDLTQAYFTRFLEKRFLDDIEGWRGPFRSFLRVSARHFLHNEHDRENALKRGGGRAPIPLQVDDGEARYRLEPVEWVTPELLFERAWVRTLLDRALSKLDAEHVHEPVPGRLAQLRPFLTGEGVSTTYEELAKQWGVGPTAVRVAVHRLRRRFGALLREEVRRTVPERSDVGEEVRYLLKIAGS